jgi:hypothetical protein
MSDALNQAARSTGTSPTGPARSDRQREFARGVERRIMEPPLAQTDPGASREQPFHPSHTARTGDIPKPLYAPAVRD